MNSFSPELIKQAAKVLRCIGHPERLRLVERLEGQKLSVNELMVKLKRDQVTISKHLAVLKQNGIVKSETQGNHRFYSIVYPNVINILNCMRRHGRTK